MRTHYRNGDSIGLTGCGCDGCSPVSINSVLCHESGCPDAWRDQVRTCPNCGVDFHPADRHQLFCHDLCAADYYGLPSPADLEC